MYKITISILMGVIALISFGIMPQPVQAETQLPASDWYAVIWNRTDDTLHWVNDATELASIPRPQMPGEIMGTDLYISPNGRWMMMTALLEDQLQGLGFYDLQSGEWRQIHTAQPGESIISTERNPFTRNSEYAAIGLHSDTGWRVITFETATGDAIDVLTGDHPDIAPDFVPSQAVPRVTLYSLDDGLAQWRVHIRFVTLGPNQSPTSQPSLGWYPAQDIVYVDSFDTLLLDLDILSIQGRVLYSLRDANEPTVTRIYGQTLGHQGEVVYEQGGAFIVQPRWVAGGQFVAYRVTQGAQVPMWYLGGYGSDNLIPFAPDYDELLGTVDGFVLVDYEGGEVKFANTLAFEAYTPTVGNVIYTTDTSNFHIAYITPMGLDFTLESLAPPPDNPIVDGGGDVVQQPGVTQIPDEGITQDEPPSRVTVGDQFRVINRVGVRLGQDDYIFPSNGTIGTILAPANPGFWQVEIAHEGGVVIGSMPEGTYQRGASGMVEYYFIEPITTVEVDPNLHNACNNTPPPRLINGSWARVTQTDGAPLNLRETPDGIIAHQIPEGMGVMVQSERICVDGYYWYFVSASADVQGWAAEGIGGTYYLEPSASMPVNLDATAVATRTPAPTVPPRTPTSDDGDCSSAPVGANLTVGGLANVTLDAGSTLAMRAAVDDPTPFYNVANGRTVRVVDGPVCNGGFRMWNVSLGTPDGEIIGWVADGFGNNRYLQPTP